MTSAIAYLCNDMLHQIDVAFSELRSAYDRQLLFKKKFSPDWLDGKIRNGSSCATKLSHAFNEAGSDIVKDTNLGPGRMAYDAQGNKYIVSAREFASVLNIDNQSHRIASLNSINGKTGIIYFENYHIDLWDNNTMVGNGNAVYNKPLYFMEIK